MSTRQYARLVDEWVTAIGLRKAEYGTHSLRRTKAAMIYRATGNIRAIQILLGYPSDPLGWLRMMSQELPARLRWAEHPEIAEFNATCRLDAVAPRAARLQASDTVEPAELARYQEKFVPAIARLKTLLTSG